MNYSRWYFTLHVYGSELWASTSTLLVGWALTFLTSHPSLMSIKSLLSQSIESIALFCVLRCSTQISSLFKSCWSDRISNLSVSDSCLALQKHLSVSSWRMALSNVTIKYSPVFRRQTWEKDLFIAYCPAIGWSSMLIKNLQTVMWDEWLIYSLMTSNHVMR